MALKVKAPLKTTSKLSFMATPSFSNKLSLKPTSRKSKISSSKAPSAHPTAHIPMFTTMAAVLLSLILLIPPSYPLKFGIITNLNQAANAIQRIQNGIKMATKNNISTEPYKISMRRVYLCDGMSGMREGLNLILNQSVNVIFGGLCSASCKATAQAADYWKISYFPLNCFDSTMDDSSVYTTVIRIFGSLTAFGSAFRTLFMHYKWNRAAVLTDGNTGFCSFGITAIRRRFRDQGISIFSVVEVATKLDGSEGLALERLRKTSRIIILCHSKYDMMRRLIFTAQDMGMTDPKEYVWIVFYNIYSDFPFHMLFEPWNNEVVKEEEGVNKTALVSYDYESKDYSDQGMNSRPRISLPLNSLHEESADYKLPDKNQSQHNQTTKLRQLRRKRDVEAEREATLMYRKQAFLSVKIMTYKNFTVLPEERGSRNKFNLFDYLTDITYLYLKLRDMVVDWGEDPLDGTSILNATKTVSISGVTQQIRFNDNADRIMSFQMWGLSEVSPTFYPYLEINLSSSNKYKAHLSNQEWWGKSKIVPLDTPLCGFNYENCNKNDDNLIIGLSVGSLTFLSLVTIIIALRISNKEHRIYKMSWKIEYVDLEFLTKPRSSSRSFEVSDTVDDQNVVFNSFRTIPVPSGNLRAMYKGLLVSVHYSNKRDIKLSRKELIELVSMKELQHDNLITFVGACLDNDKVCYLTSYCSRGSLQDIISDKNVKLDWSFKISFITDIAKGLQYLHKSFMNSHGRLNSNHCLVDNRWVIKLSNFGIDFLKKYGNEDNEQRLKNLLWVGPELLRRIHPFPGTQKGDIYSFAIIMHEIVYRLYPYQLTSLSEKAIVTRIREYNTGAPLRPPMNFQNAAEIHPVITNLIIQCWDEDPSNRPSFDNITKLLQKELSSKNDSIVDSMLEKLEKYANNLEEIVQQRTEELVEEKRKTDGLLHSMLPAFIAEELKAGLKVEPKVYQSTTLYFSDIVGFTTLSSQSSPMQIVDLLNELYGAFDDTISKHKVYKVETIGDAYMVVSGIPEAIKTHVMEICNMALDLLNVVKTFKIRHRPDMMLMLRIGIHSGPCAAGVVGHKMPRYCLFGDTVNTASRMESTGEALKIHVSSQTHHELLVYPEYILELRGPVELKGKGTMITHWLLRKDK